MRSITVEVPGRPPTPNARRHWRAIANDNAVWKDRAWIAAMGAMERYGWPVKVVMVTVGKGKKPKVEPRQIAVEPMQYAEAMIAIVVPDRREHDYDNGVCSLKPILDGMKAAGIVFDDSIRRIPKRTYEYVHQAHLSKVVLMFTEMHPPDSLGL